MTESPKSSNFVVSKSESIKTSSLQNAPIFSYTVVSTKEDFRGPLLGKQRRRLKISDGRKQPDTDNNEIGDEGSSVVEKEKIRRTQEDSRYH